MGGIPSGFATGSEPTAWVEETAEPQQEIVQENAAATTFHAEIPDGPAAEQTVPPVTSILYDDVDLASTGNAVSFAEGAEILRKAMAARKTTIVIEVMLDKDYGTEACHMLYDEAIRHTGVPNEGDYIQRNGPAWSARISHNEEEDGWYNKITYTFSYYTTAAQEKMVDAEVDRVLNKLDVWEASDYEKVCAIYDYICDTVTYDYANLYDDSYTLKYTSYAAFINKTAVCQGYATMFYRLALELGVDARYIRGTANGGNHGWNIVKIAGHYYNVDATWDAGDAVYSYFLCGVNTFYGHTRRVEYDTVEFHADYPTSRWNYAAWLDPEDGVIEAGYCNNGVQWAMYTDNTLAFFGDGAIPDYNAYNTPWSEYAYRVGRIYFDTSITHIGKSAFCDFDALRGTYISDGVQSIGEDAFYDSDVLVYVGLPCDLKTLGNWAFGSCDALLRIYFYGGAPQIGTYAFSGVNATAYYYDDGTWTTTNRESYGGSLSWRETGGYRIIFRNWNGRAIYADFYNYGEEIDIPYVPGRPEDSTYVYNFSGWNPAVSATCRGEATYTATFKAVEKKYTPGDITGDYLVTNDDVVFLLWYTLFPEDYDVDASVDFNGDGSVTNDDVIYLLWHTLFGEAEYPMT